MLAVARRPPRNEYLLFDAHPPTTTPYTASDSVARMNSTPMFRSAIWNGHWYVTDPFGLLATTCAIAGTRSADGATPCLMPPQGMTAMEMMITKIITAG